MGKKDFNDHIDDGMRGMGYGLKVYSAPLEAPKGVAADNDTLAAIYTAAKMGLKSEDTIAYNAGLTPAELRKLKSLDPRVAVALQAGKAEGELEMAMVLNDAARRGDPRSALEVLKHSHGWVATTAIKHEGDLNITLSTGVPGRESNELPELKELKDPNDLGEV